jgi:hypothetical protein
LQNIPFVLISVGVSIAFAAALMAGFSYWRGYVKANGRRVYRVTNQTAFNKIQSVTWFFFATGISIVVAGVAVLFSGPS